MPILWRVSLSSAIAPCSRMENRVLQFFKPEVKCVYLETGSSSAGYNHIVSGKDHGFEKILGVKTTDISTYIYSVLCKGEHMTYGYYITDRPSLTDPDRKGLEVIYQIDSDKFLNVAYGDNGFIVTAIPSKEDEKIRKSHY